MVGTTTRRPLDRFYRRDPWTRDRRDCRRSRQAVSQRIASPSDHIFSTAGFSSRAAGGPPRPYVAGLKLWDELTDEVKQWDRDSVRYVDPALAQAGWGAEEA